MSVHTIPLLSWGPRAETVSSPARAAKILLVDDNPLQLKSLRLHLETAGYRVATAVCANEALRAVRREIPDLVLSDVMMPGTDGFQLCRGLRRDAAAHAVPVVLISGHYGDRLDLRHAAHCGANMFVSRSDGPEGIVRGVRMALKHPETRLEPDADAALDTEHNGRLNVQLERFQQQYRTIFEGLADGVFLTDGAFKVCDANLAAENLFGYTLEEVRGKSLLSLAPPQDRARLAAETPRYVETGRFDGDFPFQHKDGSARQGQFTGRRVRPDLYVNIVRDVTKQRHNEELLNVLAYTDQLTGLANRTAFQQKLEYAAECAIGGGYAAGVLILWLGNFREINDTLGPVGGDHVLVETAARLTEAVAGAEIVCARLGASQFGVLLPRLDGPQHLARAAQALCSVLATPISVGGIPVEVAPSIGSAQCPDDAVMGSELLRRASVAMHSARDQSTPFAAYRPDMDPFSLQRLTLVSELRHAILHNQLELWYQPKLNLRGDSVEAVEALVRWRHPQRGLIPPDDFIPAAERTGLIHLITGWVLKTGLQQAKRWRDQGLPLNIAINISPSDLRHASFQAEVLEAVRVTGVPADSVTLEITENAVMQDPKRVAQILGELRQQGLRISLDDFGTGQASLAHLHRLPLDEIKLDKSFVTNLPDGHSHSIARATAILAREFGLKSVAEGVENAHSMQLLGELGFDRVQGYHLSKPLPAAELEAWIAKRNAPLQVAAA